ncbi:MAG TPA: hypothetical protein VLT32_06775 [Candidatus Sulfomarinibacteraceae bacterium]|nr:hypothetical protein [Candidatus Sulfomarinibacteraceae bacterium]
MKLNLRILIGVLLLVGGILAAVYGGFTYTEESHSADLGPVELSVEEERTVNIPLWAGIGAAALGAVALAVRKPS